MFKIDLEMIESDQFWIMRNRENFAMLKRKNEKHTWRVRVDWVQAIVAKNSCVATLRGVCWVIVTTEIVALRDGC